MKKQKLVLCLLLIISISMVLLGCNSKALKLVSKETCASGREAMFIFELTLKKEVYKIEPSIDAKYDKKKLSPTALKQLLDTETLVSDIGIYVGNISYSEYRESHGLTKFDKVRFKFFVMNYKCGAIPCELTVFVTYADETEPTMYTFNFKA